ncbi:MAG: hypothetical protein D6814_05065 [Calditrichaeota bacterium]|nr:MAG: hypothetical protein D6814_05065 [Calditrichota bacterium]
MRHYSPKTYKTYAMWIRKLQHFSHEKAPDSLSSEDVKAFLTHLAVNRKVAASTQNQAFNALLFLFHHILKVVKLLYGCGLRLFECLQLRINHYLHNSGAVRP